ncbi:MAG: transglycosylase SLT domain-containing protein [Bdellovibrionia bacterium]
MVDNLSSRLKYSFQGLMLGLLTSALFGCTTTSSQRSEQLSQALQEQNCNKLKSLTEDKSTAGHDFVQLQYTLKCDLTFKYTLRNPQWYQPLVLEIQKQKAASTPNLDDDLQYWYDTAKSSRNKKEKEELYQKVISWGGEDPLTLKAQDELYALSPRLSPQADTFDKLILAQDYRDAIENKKALEIINTLLKEKIDLSTHLKALELKRQVLRSLQNKKEIVTTTKEILDLHQKEFKQNKKQNAADYLKSSLLHGRAVWTENNPTQAREIFKAAATELKGLQNLGELYWVLGKLEDEQKNTARAREYFTLALNEPENTFTARALWSAGWLEYKEKNYTQAREWLRKLSEKDQEDHRAKFWAARALKNIENNEELLKKELSAIIEQDPLGYYGVLARRELKQTYTPITIANNNIDFSVLKNWISAQDYEDLLVLLDLAPNDVKKLALEDLHQNKVPAQNIEAQFKFGKLYAKAKLYLPLIAMIQKLPAYERQVLLQAHPELIFPTDYLSLVKKEAEKNNIPTEFPLSIIRQESTFNPEARSPVDALGLMQMMPALAQKNASRVGVTYTTPFDLFKPEVNIPLGVDELSQLLKRYKGSYILASAGYNASPKAIAGWIEQRHRTDALEFIEEVGYDETRTYIKLMLRNFIIYRQLTTKEPFLFPEELLKVL